MAQEAGFQIISLLKDLQRQVNYLEKKIDMLVGQSTEGHSSAKSYSQSPRTYVKPKHYKDNSESPFGMKNAHTGSSFENKRSKEGRGFSKKRGSEGRGFPKNNKSFKPANKKRSNKSK